MASAPVLLQQGEYEDASSAQGSTAAGAPVHLSAGEYEDAPKPAPAPEPDYAHPAGLNGGTAPQLKAPTVDVQPQSVTQAIGLDPSNVDIQKQRDFSKTPAGRAWAASAGDDDLNSEVPGGAAATKALFGAGKEVVSGLKDVYSPTDAEMQAGLGAYERGIGATPLTAAQQSEVNRKTTGGAAKVVEGGGTLALAADAPELLETAGVATGVVKAGISEVADIAAQKYAQRQIGKLALSFGIGYGASEGAGAIADKAHANPETKALVQALAFFTPTVATAAGIKGFAGETAEGKGIGFSAFAKTDPVTGKPIPGTGIHGVAGVSPEGVVGAGVKVGNRPFRGIRYGNTAPDPTTIAAQQILEANTTAMQDSARADAAAQLIVKGASPADAVAAQQPKPPPTPADQAAAQMFPNPVIQPQHMEAAAQIIKSVPPEHQGPLILQAHDQLAAQIAKWTTFVGPDGKTYTNNSPKDPAKYASQFINAEVDKHDAGVAAAQKQQEAAQKAAVVAPSNDFEGQATPAKGTSKLQQAAADKQYARAKTVIESSDSPQAAVEAMEAGGVSPEQARQFIARHQAEQVPTVGSKNEPVVEESRATVDAQLAALKAGTIKAVMLPAGSAYRPAAPAGMKVMDVTGEAPGAGRYIYDPTKLRPSTIAEAAKAGTHGVLMGHVDDKESLAAASETIAVVAHKPDGTEIQASEVTPEHAEAQAAILHERHPDAQISVKPIDEVIGDRVAANEAEGEKLAPIVLREGEFEDQPNEGSSSFRQADHDSLGGNSPTSTAASREVESDTPHDRALHLNRGEFEDASPSSEVPRIEGHDGNATTVHTPDAKYPGTYRLVEAGSLVPSHDAQSFAANPAYPKGVQERDYEKEGAKHRVISQAQNIEPDYLLNNNPDAVNGPPITTPNGTVLGGNSRTMTVQRAYSEGKQGAIYKKALLEKAAQFGFTPEQVAAMKNPIVTREIAAPGTLDEMERIGSVLNKNMTGALTPNEKAVSAGRKITPEAMDEVSRLIDSAGDNASIRDMLREDGVKALQLLESSGALTEREAQQYIDNGALSEAGKDFIENALLGHVVDDPKLMDAVPKSILNKLDGCLAAITSLSAKDDEYDIIGAIRGALEQQAEITARKTNVGAFQKQDGLLAKRDENPVVDAISRKLAEKPTMVKKAMRSFAADAKDARRGQGGMFATSDAASDKFNDSFGTTLSEREYHDGIAEGVFGEEPRAAKGSPAESDWSLQASGAGEPASGSAGELDRVGSGSAEFAGPEEVTRTYTAEVREYAGDPNPKHVELQAVNRRHAETLLAEQHPGKHISDIDRAPETTPAEGQPAALEPYSPKKDERVRYRKDGKEKTGLYKAAFGSGSSVRIAPDGGGKPDIISKRAIVGPAGNIETSPGGGTVLRGSAFGVDIAAQAVAKTVKVAWEKDVAPHLPALGRTTKEIGNFVVHLVAPVVGTPADVVDALMRLKGDQESAMFKVEQVFRGVEKMFDRLPEESRISFLDRYKRGETQFSPELDRVADMYRALDTVTYRRIVDAQAGAMDTQARRVWDRLSPAEREDFYQELERGRSYAQAGDDQSSSEGDKAAQQRIVLQRIADGVISFQDNHLRAFWKVIPGSLEERNAPLGKRNPLRGDRGFTKRSSLPDVSTGLAAGGVLESTNPQKLVEVGQSNSLRFVTALNMWKEIGDLGMRKFVPLGELPPDGWEKINDSIAKVYFPVTILQDQVGSLPDTISKDDLRTHKAVIQTGEWYVEQGTARLLNNYLSKGWFQTNALGRGLLAVKNLSTAIELSLSPFHLAFEAIEAVGSQFGLGLMHSLNIGIGEGDGKAFLEGLRASATSPAAPFTMARAGGSAIKMVRDLQGFAATSRGRDFLKKFPDATHLIDLYFTGGGTLGQPREFRTTMMDGVRSSLTDGNYLGAFARAVPALGQEIMRPLFDTYIPRIKLGFFLQMMSQQLAENHDALIRGDVTEAEIARKVVSTVENRFGELNFSNLWWTNTFKGAMQFAFRSVTWKLGNWRGATSGVVGQAKAFADPLKTMYDDAKGYRKGADRRAGEYIPKLDMNMSWLLGMAVTTAVIGTLLAKLIGGKYPWEYLDEDRENGMSAAGALALEMAHPRTGGVDPYTGKPVRLSLPTGLRDFEHGAADPRGYLRGSESGFVGKTLDTWNNRDFLDNYVYDPNGTVYQKLARIMAYNAPLPITVQTIIQGHQSGDYTRAKLGAFGLSTAPKTLDMTPLERHMEAVARSKHVPQTPEERDAYQAKMRGIRDGTIRGPERNRALKAASKPYLIKMFDKLDYAEAKKAYNNFASEEEKEVLRHALDRKRANQVRRNPGSTFAAEQAEK